MQKYSCKWGLGIYFRCESTNSHLLSNTLLLPICQQLFPDTGQRLPPNPLQNCFSHTSKNYTGVKGFLIFSKTSILYCCTLRLFFVSNGALFCSLFIH